jgi:flagellar hook-associated protein 2
MATISSTGIGSGLDVNSIVSQLVALEKQPLKTLALKATNVQAQVSAFGKVQSQFAALTDVATRISAATVWGGRNASSSNASAVTIVATAAANATSFSLDVDALAQLQAVSSTALTPGTMPGAGTLTLQLGTWSAGGAAFTPGAAASVNVTILATDTISAIATKINGANAGVVATVFNDGANEHLLLQSKNTGAAAGFRVQSTDAALAGLVFDPGTPATSSTGMAANPVQYGQDAKARINGLAVTSASNTLTDNIPGVTIKLLATTTTDYRLPGEVRAPLTMSISEDVTPAVKNVSDFVAAYNDLNKTLSDLTRYDAATKTAGLFQGDSSVVGLQNVLRNMLGSISQGGGAYQRLADVGLERQLDGSLTINIAKLSGAANDGTTSLQQLFTTNNGNFLTNGFALKFAELGRGVLTSGGSVANKVVSLKNALDRNSKEQTKVNERATLVETRLKQRYSVLDAQMGQLTALNAYVTQQVTLWNRSTG